MFRIKSLILPEPHKILFLNRTAKINRIKIQTRKCLYIYIYYIHGLGHCHLGDLVYNDKNINKRPLGLALQKGVFHTKPIRKCVVFAIKVKYINLRFLTLVGQPLLYFSNPYQVTIDIIRFMYKHVRLVIVIR